MFLSDMNGNYRPPVYTRNTNNSPTHIETLMQSLRALPFRRPAISSYLDKYLADISVEDPWQEFVDDTILPMLKEREQDFPNDDSHFIVFVYDIEEITMLSFKHRTVLSKMRPDINSTPVYDLADSVLTSLKFESYYDPLQDVVGTIKDVFDGVTDTLKEITPKYKALKQLYEEISDFCRKKSIISRELIEKCGMIDNEREICRTAKKLQKIYRQRWRTVDKCLQMVCRKKRSEEKPFKKYENVVICEEGIAKGAAQLLVSGHSSTIPIENIYSTFRMSKESVFERIQKRFGDKCVLLYVTSFPEDQSIPNNEPNIAIWTVSANESIKLLYHAQRDYLLKKCQLFLKIDSSATE